MKGEAQMDFCLSNKKDAGGPVMKMSSNRGRTGWLFGVLIFSFVLIHCGENEVKRGAQEEITNEPAEQVSAGQPAEDYAPGGVAKSITGNIVLHKPKPGFKGAPVSFSWKLFPGASTYRIELMDVEQTIFYEGIPFVENLVTLPPEVTAGLETDTIYFWRIVAFDEAEEEIAGSPFRDFLYLP
jgi:hypothetical protein